MALPSDTNTELEDRLNMIYVTLLSIHSDSPICLMALLSYVVLPQVQWLVGCNSQDMDD